MARAEAPAAPVTTARSPGALGFVVEGLAAWLPALPLLLLAALFLVAPTLELVYRSFHGADGWTLAFWESTLHSNGSRTAIRTSVQLGVTCATLSLLIGAPVAWLLSRMVRSRRVVWLALLNVAANFGGVGLAFGYVAALGTYGMVTLALAEMGIGWTPPKSGTFESLVIAYEYVNIPLFVLLTLPAMAILRREWVEAAETAAASRVQFWRYVGIPILTPFVVGGWLLIFTWSVGIYGLALAMGGAASTIGQLRLITLQIGITLNTGAGKEERAYVLAVILLLLAAISLLGYRAIMKWALRWFQ